MYDPTEVVAASRAELRLFEAVFRAGFDPCLNGIWDLCERKIGAALSAGHTGRAERWRKVRLLERRTGENIGAQIDLEGERSHLRFHVDGERRWIEYERPTGVAKG